MKAIIALILTTVCVHCQTWTFHSAETVNPVVTVTSDGTWNAVPGWYVINYQYGVNDYGNPVSFQNQWLWQEQILQFWTPTGGVWDTTFYYLTGNTLTINQPPVDVWVEGAIPDYFGYSDYGALATGEYWFDISPAGYDFRLSTTQPTDFGKWLWDGSINPNYVSPLAPKKHHGKK